MFACYVYQDRQQTEGLVLIWHTDVFWMIQILHSFFRGSCPTCLFFLNKSLRITKDTVLFPYEEHWFNSPTRTETYNNNVLYSVHCYWVWFIFCILLIDLFAFFLFVFLSSVLITLLPSSFMSVRWTESGQTQDTKSLWLHSHTSSFVHPRIPCPSLLPSLHLFPCEANPIHTQEDRNTSEK